MRLDGRAGLRVSAGLTVAPVATSGAALALIGIDRLMALHSGAPEVGIGLADGPVSIDHPDLAGARISALGRDGAACAVPDSGACVHGTFVAGILVARRTSSAPAICPGCTLFVRPIFRETAADGSLPTATPEDVGDAIVECVDAGARVVNLSAATGEPTTRAEGHLRRSLDHVTRRGALVVAAAGNQGTLGTSEITRHPGVVPVVGYDLSGSPMHGSNLGRSMALHGIGAPGEDIVSSVAGSGKSAAPRAGTSFSAAFVTGAVALLWSMFPDRPASAVRRALTHGSRRRTIVPPLLDAYSAYEFLASGSR